MHDRNALTRRRALAATAACAALACLPVDSIAQAAWPERPIRLLVPFAPGGGSDVIARAVATKLGALLGQQVVVENRVGAGGAIANDAVAKAPPDGYTLLFATSATVTNLSSGKKLPYDLERDFAHIGQIGATPPLLVVPRDSPLKTMRDLLELARAKPGAVSFGSAGVGSFSHLAMELVAAEAKVQLIHVPYKGTVPAFTDLIAGNLAVVLSSFASARPLLEGGRLRALVVTGTRRSSLAPDVPTLAEVGLAGAAVDLWWGLLAPAATPAAVVGRLNRELNAVLQDRDMREQLAREVATATPGTPESFGRLFTSEAARWSKLIRDANIKVE
jgi:tripartite-type tricarboxylate transporter receptor subunit TctC